MFRLSSFSMRVAVIATLVCVLALVPFLVLACAGPAGPVGPAGPSGEAAIALPGAWASISPTSVVSTEGMISVNKVAVTGAGFGPEEVVYVVMVIDGNEQAIVGGKTNKSGAFSLKSTMKIKLEVAPGLYTVKAIGDDTGTVASVGFKVE